MDGVSVKDALSWIKDNPAVFATIVSAVIAASVAVIVFAVTQFLTAKRNRASFLVPKLEELYLTLNEMTADNAIVCTLAIKAIDRNEEALLNLRGMNELDLYGHRTAKRILLYIRLYFPQLSLIHKRLYAARQAVSGLVFKVVTGQMPPMADMLKAAGLVTHFGRLMEAEIVSNRDSLIGDRFWPPRYRQSTAEELDAVPRIPDKPLWATKQEEKKAPG